MTTTHKIIFALDSFKGCLSSVEAGQAAAEGAETEAAEVLNVSDGGDGMLRAFCQAYRAEQVSCNCHDALMRPIRAAYGLVGDMAIIETAQACGLSLLESNERDAVGGTSYGVGELLIDAFERGARRFIIGLGGTATTDGGFGMLKALYVHAGPAAFFDTYLPRWRNECSWTLASDVRNPLYGPQGAAACFCPTKGSYARRSDAPRCTFATFGTACRPKDGARLFDATWGWSSRRIGVCLFAVLRRADAVGSRFIARCA